MVLKRRLLVSGSLFAAVLALLAVFGPSGLNESTKASHGGMDDMSIDMNPAGNSASGIGTIDQCARIQKDSVQNYDEDFVDGIYIDIVAASIPAYNNNGTPSNGADDSGGIIAYYYTLNYPSNFTVTAQQSDSSTVNILASNAGSSIFTMQPVSDPLPDNEESNYNAWTGQAIDTADPAASTPESGSGVLDRLTLSIDSTASPLPSQYFFHLSDNGHLDAGQADVSYSPHTTGFANIAVNQACGTLVSSLGYYHPVTPKRILDTRGSPYGPIGVPAAGKIGAGDGAVITVDVTDTQFSGVPASGVTAVVINTTVTEPTLASHLTVFPSGAGVPNAANLNFVAGETRPNLVTVKVGPDGTVKIRNQSGQTHVTFDIQGWYGTPTVGSRYNPIPPKRILDTRPAPFGPIGVPSAGKIGAGDAAALTVDVTNTQGSGVPDTGVTAVIVNVTAVAPTANSHLTIYPSDAFAAPNAANLNFVAGQPPVPNLVIVKVGPANGGSVKVRNHSGSVDVIFDIVGWFGTSSGDVFNPVTPDRILDTRPAPFGPIGVPAAGKLGPGDGAVLTLDVTNTQGSGVPDGASAVIVNVTVTEPTAPSHLTVYPSDVVTPPNAANLNFVTGQTVPNLVAVKVGPANGGSVKIRNHTGSTHVIFDVAGYFAPPP